jgi:hypothetical protein
MWKECRGHSTVNSSNDIYVREFGNGCDQLAMLKWGKGFVTAIADVPALNSKHLRSNPLTAQKAL